MCPKDFVSNRNISNVLKEAPLIPTNWNLAGEELCRSTGLSCLGVARRAKTEVPIKCTVISGLKSRAPITTNINLSLSPSNIL